VTTRDLSEYLTIKQAAKLLHRKSWPVYQAMQRGELSAFQPSNGGAWLIRPAGLEIYVGRFANRVTGGSLHERLARARGEGVPA
jgi:hypothetical protein